MDNLMGTPKRIQRKRTKGWKMPENTIYVGRPTKWGNAYTVGAIDEITGKTITHGMARAMFRILWSQTAFQDLFKPRLNEIRGKNLACWCRLDQACHADVLLEMANG